MQARSYQRFRGSVDATAELSGFAAFSAREKELQDLEAELKEKERNLLQLAGAQDPTGVIALRWASLLEERKQSTARWAMLQAEKDSVALILKGALEGPPIVTMQEPKPDPNPNNNSGGDGGGRPVIGASTRAAIHQVGPTCALWSVQQARCPGSPPVCSRRRRALYWPQHKHYTTTIICCRLLAAHAS